jgi:hypothetical protein
MVRRREILRALRVEPGMRAYLLGSLLDDVGVAASSWATHLMLASLFVDQRTRAMVMMPSLVCFILGALVGGPIADWAGRYAAQHGLAKQRWQVVVWGRAIETLGLFAMAVALIGNEPTIARTMPYFLLSAFMKTALRPTRISFEVDLLRETELRTDAEGRPVLDEKGRPIHAKKNLLLFSSWLTACSAAATLVGLVLGGQIMSWLGGRIYIVLLVDVLTNLVFVGVLWKYCRPDTSDEVVDSRESFHRSVGGVVRDLGRSFVEVFAFLRHPSRRPLLALLCGAVLIEMIAECYDGRMIVKQVLHGSNDALRWSELAWSCATLGTMFVLPLLARRVPQIGRLFVGMMLLDALVMMLAGRAAATAVFPFAVALSFDRGLTAASGTLAGLAQNTSSSSALRGRLIAVYTLVVLVVDMVAQGVATGMAETFGIPRMVSMLGVFQAIVIVILAIVGGRGLWNLRASRADTPALQNA